MSQHERFILPRVILLVVELLVLHKRLARRDCLLSLYLRQARSSCPANRAREHLDFTSVTFLIGLESTRRTSLKRMFGAQRGFWNTVPSLN